MLQRYWNALKNGGGGGRVYGTLSLEIQGEKRGTLSIFWLKSGGSHATGIEYGITAQMEA